MQEIDIILSCLNNCTKYTLTVIQNVTISHYSSVRKGGEIRFLHIECLVIYYTFNIYLCMVYDMVVKYKTS